MSISAHQMMAWLSPSFPTGAFAYSHGLEYAIYAGEIVDADGVEQWIAALLERGSAWNDAVLLVQTYSGEDVKDLAQALTGGSERLQETLDQGRAFARTASKLLGHPIDPAPLPIVLGTAARRADMSIEEFLPLTLHAFAANLVFAAIRLVPLGQTEGQLILQNLFPVFDRVSKRAIEADIEDLGTSCFTADIGAMQHEMMATRIFRT